MKHTHLLLALLTVSAHYHWPGTATAAEAAAMVNREFVIVVSPFLDQGDREDVYRATAGFILEDASPGDAITILNGINLELVTDVTIPVAGVFRNNASARVRALGKELTLLREFFLAERPHAPQMTGVIHAPQALELAATHLRRQNAGMVVILVGSPFYADADGVFNMLNGYVPSDEHLRSFSQRSVYGTADRKGALQGITVHYAFLHESFDHAEHRKAVGRVWHLFIQEQQGCLASWAASPAVVFRRVRDRAQNPVIDATLSESDRTFLMRRVEHFKVEASSTRTNRVPAVSVQEQQTNAVVSPPISEVIPLQPPVNLTLPVLAQSPDLVTNIIPKMITSGRQGIGIVWSVLGLARQGVDVDLNVRLPRSGVELYFQSKEAPEGKYLRDIVQANGEAAYESDPKANWEFVDLDGDVPLSETQVWLDLFRNDAREAVEGVVIVVTQGRVLQTPFRFPADLSGDGRSRAAARSTAPAWQLVDIRSLLATNSHAQSAGTMPLQ